MRVGDERQLKKRNSKRQKHKIDGGKIGDQNMKTFDVPSNNTRAV